MWFFHLKNPQALFDSGEIERKEEKVKKEKN